MKVYSILILALLTACALNAQETTNTYKKAIAQIKNTPEFKNSGATVLTASSQTISFDNQAYAFWLDGLDTRFNNKDFENFYGDLYQPTEITAFKDVREKRRSTHQLFVSETDNELFVIEMLSRKRKRKPKYPKFYQGSSISFLFEKTEDGVRLIETLTLQNN